MFEATVTGANGDPVAGLDLFVQYEIPPGVEPVARSDKHGGFISVAYPTPTASASKIVVRIEESMTLRAQVFDLEETLLDTPMDEEVGPGEYEIQLDLTAYGPSTVYSVVVESFRSAQLPTRRRYVALTDGEIGEPLRFRLGQTDGQGRVVVTDRRRFPSFYDIPELDMRDADGIFYGFLPFSDDVTLVLRDAQGNETTVPYTLNEEANAVALSWVP